MSETKFSDNIKQVFTDIFCPFIEAKDLEQHTNFFLFDWSYSLSALSTTFKYFD